MHGDSRDIGTERKDFGPGGHDVVCGDIIADLQRYFARYVIKQR